MLLEYDEYEYKYRTISKRTSFFCQENRQISSTLICSICKEIFIEPTQTECGCRFCFQCITNYAKDNKKTCPGCETDIFQTKFIRDKAIDKEISNLEIKCFNDGCDLICKSKDMKDHWQNCEYRIESCENCDDLITYKFKKQHCIELCKKLVMKCNDCGLHMTREDLESKHKNIQKGLNKLCENFKGLCPNKCDEEIHDNLKLHLQICPQSLINSPNNNMGGDIIETSNDIIVQLQNNIIKHQELMMQEIIRLKNENLNLNKSIQSINTSAMQEIENLKRMNSELIINIEKLKIKENQNSKIIKKVNSNLDKNEYQTNETKKSIVIGVNVGNEECIWTIRDIRQKCIDAKSTNQTQIISEPFYMTKPGYKMRLKIYLNGDGQAINNYLSIYFVIVKGDYDDKLSWPFKQKITLAIISNEEIIPNITFNMLPDNNLSCYGRPITDTNVGAGQPKALKITKLLNENHYLHNGSLKIKLKTNNKNLIQ